MDRTGEQAAEELAERNRRGRIVISCGVAGVVLMSAIAAWIVSNQSNMTRIAYPKTYIRPGPEYAPYILAELRAVPETTETGALTGEALIKGSLANTGPLAVDFISCAVRFIDEDNRVSKEDTAILFDPFAFPNPLAPGERATMWSRLNDPPEGWEEGRLEYFIFDVDVKEVKATKDEGSSAGDAEYNMAKHFLYEEDRSKAFFDYYHKKNLDPNGGVGGANYMLIVAAAAGRLDAIEFLLTEGADPNMQDGAALNFALVNKEKEILLTLVEHGGVIPKASLKMQQDYGNELALSFPPAEPSVVKPAPLEGTAYLRKRVEQAMLLGATKSEISAALGTEGKKIKASSIGEHTRTVMAWTSITGIPVRATFEDDALVDWAFEQPATLSPSRFR